MNSASIRSPRGLTSPSVLMRLAWALFVTAVLSWVVLHATDSGGRVWTEAGLHVLREGDVVSAVEALSRAESLSGGARASWLLGMAQIRNRDQTRARQALLRSTLNGPPRDRARGYHALSALHLAAAAGGPRAVGTAPASPAAAARAAVDGLRLLPGDAGLAWNLGVARRVGGFPEPEVEPAAMNGALTRTLRAALATVEARNLQESLGAIVQELELRASPEPTEGPPW